MIRQHRDFGITLAVRYSVQNQAHGKLVVIFKQYAFKSVGHGLPFPVIRVINVAALAVRMLRNDDKRMPVPRQHAAAPTPLLQQFQNAVLDISRCPMPCILEQGIQTDHCPARTGHLHRSGDLSRMRYEPQRLALPAFFQQPAEHAAGSKYSGLGRAQCFIRCPAALRRLCRHLFQLPCKVICFLQTEAGRMLNRCIPVPCHIRHNP